MPTERLSMRRIRDLLRLKYAIARRSGWDVRVNLDEILRRGVRDGISLIVADKCVVGV